MGEHDFENLDIIFDKIFGTLGWSPIWSEENKKCIKGSLRGTTSLKDKAKSSYNLLIETWMLHAFDKNLRFW